MQPRSIARRAAARLFLTPLVLAYTYIVDASGGGNFSDIRAAILASQPGDVRSARISTTSPPGDPAQTGTTMFAQAQWTLASGEIRRTNSAPVIVR